MSKAFKQLLNHFKLLQVDIMNILPSFYLLL